MQILLFFIIIIQTNARLSCSSRKDEPVSSINIAPRQRGFLAGWNIQIQTFVSQNVLVTAVAMARHEPQLSERTRETERRRASFGDEESARQRQARTGRRARGTGVTKQGISHGHPVVYHPVTRHRRLYSGCGRSASGSGSAAVQEHTYEYVRQWQVLYTAAFWERRGDRGGPRSAPLPSDRSASGAGVTLDTI